ncbi:SET domain-containing protein [Basidiobolus meristosporus CBS 931.73]|uniref:SET domain-containing protein n=1 Tax=Basidiobolus meristosporus CBS 931.73 TaxID=1314790 RepID=A0A1Y1XS89_9FUNG|nr:SET domain-containing protein [Basidiobolus meristosporus CBS 931.73]|eukprot:ORX88619.1 SET domain-containing protein [Basidiobolus meristosporus CBS 931.73]
MEAHNNLVDPSGNAVQSLWEWAKTNNCYLEPLEIRLNEDGFRAVYAKRDIQEEEKIGSIPGKLVISQETARTALPQYSDLPGHVLLKVYLIHERLRGVDSFWQPYISVLPKTFSTPLWFNTEEYAVLKGTNLEFAAEEYKQKIDQEFDLVRKTLNGSTVNEHLITREMYYWATTVVSSRAFSSKLDPNATDEEDQQIMLPLLDMLNHKLRQPITWSNHEGQVSFVCNRKVAAGEEVFNNYGAKSNEELLQGYGFCIENNEVDYFALKINFRATSTVDLKELLLKRFGLTDFKHFLRRDGEIPENLAKQIRVLAMNRYELTLGQNLAAENMEFLNYRNEIAMLQMYRQLLAQRLHVLNTAVQQSSDPEEPSYAYTAGKIYRDGQLEILQLNFTQVSAKLCQVLSNATKDTVGQTDLVASLQHFLGTVITMEKVVSDREFFEVITNNIDGLDEETILALFIIRCSTNVDGRWYASLAKYQDFHDPNYSNDLFETSAGGLDPEAQEDLLNLQEMYDALFPYMTSTNPDLFPANIYTWEKFRWAASIVDSLSVTIQTPDGAVLAIVPT